MLHLTPRPERLLADAGAASIFRGAPGLLQQVQAALCLAAPQLRVSQIAQVAARDVRGAAGHRQPDQVVVALVTQQCHHPTVGCRCIWSARVDNSYTAD